MMLTCFALSSWSTECHVSHVVSQPIDSGFTDPLALQLITVVTRYLSITLRALGANRGQQTVNVKIRILVVSNITQLILYVLLQVSIDEGSHQIVVEDSNSHSYPGLPCKVMPLQ